MASPGLTVLKKVKNVATEGSSPKIDEVTKNKRTQTTSESKPASKHPQGEDTQTPGEKGAGEKRLIARDFFWDDWLSYIATGMLALAFVDLSVEFLSGSSLGILCFIPFFNDSNQDYSRDQAAFVNSWCLRLLPPTEYYPLFTLVQGIVLYIPHYLWVSIFSGNFDFFFALAGSLEGLRDRRTGQYTPRNSAIIRRLEEEFSNRRSIWLGYLAQSGVTIAAYVFFIGVTFGSFSGFETDIICPAEEDDPSPIFGRVQCVYSRFRFLIVLQWANVVFLIVGLFVAVFGLIMVFVRTYGAVLSYLKVAKFAYHSALSPAQFVPKCRDRIGSFKALHQKSDLDFLLAKLFSTDTGYGKIFKDVQVSDEIAKMLEADFQKLHIHVSTRVGQPARSAKFYVAPLDRTWLGEDLQANEAHERGRHGSMKDFIAHVSEAVAKLHDGVCSSQGKSVRAVLDISFRSHGFAFTISRYFEKVAAIHLDEHYQNANKVVRYEKYGRNLYTIQVPTNILALPIDKSRELTETIRKEFLDWNQQQQESRFKLVFIIVSGVDSSTKEATVSQLIEMYSLASRNLLADGAILMVLTPTEIEGHKPKEFRQLTFKESGYYWDQSAQRSMEDTVRQKFSLQEGDKNKVGALVELECGETRCSFNFLTFKLVNIDERRSPDYSHYPYVHVVTPC